MMNPFQLGKMWRCPCAFAGMAKIILRSLKIPIDIIPTMRYILLVLSNEGPLSRSDPSADGARAGRTGAPREGRRPGGNGGALGGAAPSLGRARCLAARGGYVNPASKGCLTQHPWRLPPLHPLAQVARDWQTSDA